MCTIGDPGALAVLAHVGCEFARDTAPDGRGPDVRLGRDSEYDPGQLAACGVDAPARTSIAPRPE